MGTIMKKLAVVIVTALAGHLQTSASAIHARLHQRRGVCDYGTMPGRFVTGQFPAWKPFNEFCALTDYITQYLNASRGQTTLGVHSISSFDSSVKSVKFLLFGDSVEQLMTADVCGEIHIEASDLLATKDWKNADSKGDHHWDHASCSSPVMVLTREATHGVLAHYDFEHSQEELPVRITTALEDFERITGDPPDIVSISLNLWDVSWWGHHRSESFDECTIPEADMHNWLQRAMQALKAVQDNVDGGRTLVVVRTTAFPAVKGASNAEQTAIDFRYTVAGRAAIAQLNSALRYLAMSLDFHIIDIEAITNTIGDARRYLRDAHHPTPEINRETLNILLNMWHEYYN